VAGDLVAGGRDLPELRPGHVLRIADGAGIDVERRVHRMRVQDRERAVLVRHASSNWIVTTVGAVAAGAGPAPASASAPAMRPARRGTRTLRIAPP
jgi:hypothetical protein